MKHVNIASQPSTEYAHRMWIQIKYLEDSAWNFILGQMESEIGEPEQ